MSLRLEIVPPATAGEVRSFPYGRFEVVRLADRVFGRAVYEPGWRWSEHVGPSEGKAWCAVAHVGVVVAGRAAVRMKDGAEVEMSAGDWFSIPPEHDSWVLGDEEYVSLHLLGAETYAAKPTGRRSSPGTAAEVISARSLAGETWAQGCLGWTLMARPSLHVMEEQMASSSSEQRHAHSTVSQMYYVLEGEATVSIGDSEQTLTAGEAIEIPPGVAHQVRNETAASLRFLVVSSGPPRQDREDVIEYPPSAPAD